MKKAPLTLNDKIVFGKHRGKTVEQVYNDDAGYLVWLRSTAANDQTNPNRRLFSNEVNLLLDDVIRNSASLRKKYEIWGAQVDGVDVEPTVEHVVASVSAQEAYQEAWGAY